LFPDQSFQVTPYKVKRVYKSTDAAAYDASRHAGNMCRIGFSYHNNGRPRGRLAVGTIPADGCCHLSFLGGTLIHNGFFAAPETPSALSVTLIQFRFDCMAVTPPCRVQLTPAGYPAAGLAAVFVPVITTAADKEHRPALRQAAK
jgi:hypothetical protein